jgi:predicted dehydrogenase
MTPTTPQPAPRRRANEPVRVAVLGVGGMGFNHARVFSTLKGVDLVGVVDTDRERAQDVAQRFGCRAFTHPTQIMSLVDAATVAVPSSLHAEVAVPLLEQGIACLVEKPLASSEIAAVQLVEAADRSGTPLLVGHIERFNPAVEQLDRILAVDHDVLAIDARRMSAVSSRITDVDVVTDLMVHDIDIVLELVGEPVVDVSARGVMRGDAPGDDFVTALLTFANGALATFTASRVTQNQVRELQVTTPERFFTVDYSNQELLIYRQGRIGGIDDESADAGRYVLDVGTERVFVRRSEPLVVELSHFVDVVRGNEPPRVTGAQALEALRLVWQIREQVGKRVVDDRG